MKWWPWKARPLAQRGEDLAAAFLRRSGLNILGRNVHLGRYELDIIAHEGDTIAFVEVKTRRDTGFAAPEDNVTPRKQLHIRRAARQFIDERDDPHVYYRFDVIAIVWPEKGKPSITHYRDAFTDE